MRSTPSTSVLHRRYLSESNPLPVTHKFCRAYSDRVRSRCTPIASAICCVRSRQKSTTSPQCPVMICRSGWRVEDTDENHPQNLHACLVMPADPGIAQEEVDRLFSIESAYRRTEPTAGAGTRSTTARSLRRMSRSRSVSEPVGPAVIQVSCPGASPRFCATARLVAESSCAMEVSKRIAWALLSFRLGDLSVQTLTASGTASGAFRPPATRSRSWALAILPICVRGSNSMTSTRSGHLNFANPEASRNSHNS
jgi:hypothetical protein